MMNIIDENNIVNDEYDKWTIKQKVHARSSGWLFGVHPTNPVAQYNDGGTITWFETGATVIDQELIAHPELVVALKLVPIEPAPTTEDQASSGGDVGGYDKQQANDLSADALRKALKRDTTDQTDAELSEEELAAIDAELDADEIDHETAVEQADSKSGAGQLKRLADTEAKEKEAKAEARTIARAAAGEKPKLRGAERRAKNKADHAAKSEQEKHEEWEAKNAAAQKAEPVSDFIPDIAPKSQHHKDERRAPQELLDELFNSERYTDAVSGKGVAFYRAIKSTGQFKVYDATFRHHDKHRNVQCEIRLMECLTGVLEAAYPFYLTQKELRDAITPAVAVLRIKMALNRRCTDLFKDLRTTKNSTSERFECLVKGRGYLWRIKTAPHTSTDSDVKEAIEQ